MSAPEQQQRNTPGLPSEPRVSVAIPVFNEIQIVDELLRRVNAVLDDIPGGPHEIVLVDDGSSDGTLEALTAAAKTDERVVVVSLSRNFGHQAAISAALDHARGDVIVTMDGDLQDSPEAIPQFLERYAEGFDVVYARRENRKEPAWLRACYYSFYRLMAAMSDLPLPLDAGDFGLISRRVADQIRNSPERNRYIRGLRTWSGFRQVGVSVERSARAAGASKFTPVKLFRLAFDGLFAFSIVPLRAAALIGGISMFLSIVYALYALFAKYALGASPQGFTAILWVMTFFSGVILLFLGVIGEYIGRIYEEVKGRPIYVVQEVVGRS